MINTETLRHGLRSYNESANIDSLRERGDFLLLSAGVPSGSVQFKTAPNPEPNIYLAELDEDEDEDEESYVEDEDEDEESYDEDRVEESYVEDKDEESYDEDRVEGRYVEDEDEDEDEESYDEDEDEDRVEESYDKDEFEEDEYDDEDYPLGKGWRYAQSNMQTRSNRSATSRQNRLSPSTPPRSLSSFQSAAPRLKLSEIYGDDDEVTEENLDEADDVGERRRKKQKTEGKRKRSALRRMKKKRTDQYANLGRMSISKIRKVLSSNKLK